MLMRQLQTAQTAIGKDTVLVVGKFCESLGEARVLRGEAMGKTGGSRGEARGKRGEAVLYRMVFA